ncbi:T9SS type A sorting domain-containing protein [Labilibacter sediminis]|nr:T9SS type A sorting domain-containing protein [Labilibacter sediminis]
MYPDPHNGNILFRFNNPLINATLNIYNSTGKTVLTTNITNDYSFIVSILDRGIYFVNMNSNRLNYLNKLIVY